MAHLFCTLSGREAKTKMISVAITTAFSEMDLSYFAELFFKWTITLSQ